MGTGLNEAVGGGFKLTLHTPKNGLVAIVVNCEDDFASSKIIKD